MRIVGGGREEGRCGLAMVCEPGRLLLEDCVEVTRPDHQQVLHGRCAAVELCRIFCDCC